MKIRALTLENVRKFGGKRVVIDQIGDGLTVVSEANEFGKSTFFDALYAVFFEKHTASGKSVQSLRPHAGGGVRIQAEVEIEGVRYGIEKRFLSQKGASVTTLANGTVIAREGEAEDWIVRHIGAVDQGPAGLLWVRQGVVGLEPADSSKTEKDRLTETRRDLLSSVAGEIDQVTGGRTMDRILRRCQEDLNLLATGKTLLPRGAWKEAVEDEKQLLAELAQLERHCADLSEALNERRTIEAELQRLDDPSEKARREGDVRAARAASQAAEAHVQKVKAAASDLEIAQLQRVQALRAYQAYVQAVEAAGVASEALFRVQAQGADCLAALTEARDVQAQARAVLATAEGRTKALRQELMHAEAAMRAQRAAAEVARLRAALDQAREHITLRAQASGRVQGNPATASALLEAEQAVAEAARLSGAVAARAAYMTIDYAGDVRVSLAGKPLDGGVPAKIENGVMLEMPGIGRVRFDLPDDTSGAKLEAELGRALAAQAAALEACGVSSIAQARKRAQDRQADENHMKLADEMLRSLAPEGPEVLEQALAVALDAEKSAPQAEVRATDDIALDLEEAERAEADLRARLLLVSERVGVAREEHASAQAELAAALVHKDRVDSAAGEPATRAARLAEFEAAVGAAQAEVSQRSASSEAVAALAPDVATAAANLKRAEAAYEAARQRRGQLAERRADVSARIDSRAEEGIEERRDEMADRLAAVQARAAHLAAEVASLARLRDALEAARDGAREAYFGPVQAELRPLLRILHDDAGLDWETDTLVPGALRRGGEVEAYDTLSGGTQEQIAILTRLAFARLFARRGQHLPIILDDALVYSDDDRIVKMFTALNRVAMDQQIIVFSCRQLAFAGLGGVRPLISVQDAT